MKDICLFNWKTERSTPLVQANFDQNATFHKGVLYSTQIALREPPTGLMILMALLEAEGYAVELFDAVLYEDPHATFEALIPEFRMIGFTSLTNTFPEILSFIHRAKQLNPSIYVVVGGPHVSFEVDVILQSIPEIDLVFIGEAEESFPIMVNQLLQKPTIDFIYDGQTSQMAQYANTLDQFRKVMQTMPEIPPGVAYRSVSTTSQMNTNQSCEIISTGFPQAVDLDRLPLPARHLISRVYRVADIIINRGCPNQCSFCSRTHLFPTMRIRPLAQVLAEVDYILSCANYQFINFYDNINIKRSYFDQFLDALIARPHMLPWGAELRSDVITVEQAQKLKQSKCRVVATGVESASDIVLKTNFKFQNVAAVRQGIQNLKAAGIGVQAYFVIGLPGDTPDEFSKTLDFLRSLPLRAGEDQVDFFVTTPYPGSDLRSHPTKYGIRILDNDFTRYDCHQILMETSTLNTSAIAMMIKQATEVKKQLGI